MDGGSSPRLRGTPRHAHRIPGIPRFIPAPAGDTSRKRSTPCLRAVHPRACGGHKVERPGTEMPNGSSPRLRGTRPHLARQDVRRRFIPAPAGDTECIAFTASATAVHPRACGGHWNLPVARDVNRGSSPRLRGTHTQAATNRIRNRFIPAPAGDTEPRTFIVYAEPVHPRACGGHVYRKSDVILDGGSSPRLRGTLLCLHKPCAAVRFIPAPAGDTTTMPTLTPVRAVHPRACGGHCSAAYFRASKPGSSPRLRGTRGASCRSCNASTVHPRACGGHNTLARTLPVVAGSSPRLRGTQFGRDRVFLLKRFIPAPAGDTVRPRSCFLA